TTYISALIPRPASSPARAVSAATISSRSIGSDAVQRALGDEDVAAAEGGGRLGDRDRPKAGDVADEPEAVEEPLRLDRPGRARHTVDRGEVLGQGAKVGVLARIPGRLGPLRDRRRARAIAAPQRELVEELAHRVVEVLSFCDPAGH